MMDTSGDTESDSVSPREQALWETEKACWLVHDTCLTKLGRDAAIACITEIRALAAPAAQQPSEPSEHDDDVAAIAGLGPVSTRFCPHKTLEPLQYNSLLRLARKAAQQPVADAPRECHHAWSDPALNGGYRKCAWCEKCERVADGRADDLLRELVACEGEFCVAAQLEGKVDEALATRLEKAWTAARAYLAQLPDVVPLSNQERES